LQLKNYKKYGTQQGAFCYAGSRTNPHRHIAYQLQSQLHEHNPALEPACRQAGIPSAFYL